MAINDCFTPSQASANRICGLSADPYATVPAITSQKFRSSHIECRPISGHSQENDHKNSRIWNYAIQSTTHVPVDHAYLLRTSKDANVINEGSSYTFCPVTLAGQPYPLAAVDVRLAVVALNFIQQTVYFVSSFWTVSSEPTLRQAIFRFVQNILAASHFMSKVYSIVQTLLCQAVSGTTELVSFHTKKITQALKTGRSLVHVIAGKVKCCLLHRLHYLTENHLSHQGLPDERSATWSADVVDHEPRTLTAGDSLQSRRTTPSSRGSGRKPEEKRPANCSFKALRSGRDNDGNQVRLKRGGKQNAANNITVQEWRCLWEAGHDDKESCSERKLTRYDSMLRHLETIHKHECYYKKYGEKTLEGHINHLNEIFKKPSDEACEMFSAMLYSIMYPDHTSIPYLRYDRLPDLSRKPRQRSATVILRADLSTLPSRGHRFATDDPVYLPTPSCDFTTTGELDVWMSDATPIALSQDSAADDNSVSDRRQMVQTLSNLHRDMNVLGNTVIGDLWMSAQGIPGANAELDIFSLTTLMSELFRLIETSIGMINRLRNIYNDLQQLLVEASTETLTPRNAQSWTSHTTPRPGNILHQIDFGLPHLVNRRLPSPGFDPERSRPKKVLSNDPDGR